MPRNFTFMNSASGNGYEEKGVGLRGGGWVQFLVALCCDIARWGCGGGVAGIYMVRKEAGGQATNRD
jgi:hypothetical protein